MDFVRVIQKLVTVYSMITEIVEIWGTSTKSAKEALLGKAAYQLVDIVLPLFNQKKLNDEEKKK